jgi:predicted metal-binding protein
MAEKAGEFGRHDTIDLVAMTHCGDCPGLTVPRVKLLKEMTAGLGRDFDVVHLGTCMKIAMETGNCPIDFEALKAVLEQKWGLTVVLGTHPY